MAESVWGGVVAPGCNISFEWGQAFHYPHFTDEKTKTGERKPKVIQLTQNSDLCWYDLQVCAPNPKREHACQKYGASLSLPGERSALPPESLALRWAITAITLTWGADPAVPCSLANPKKFTRTRKGESQRIYKNNKWQRHTGWGCLGML